MMVRLQAKGLVRKFAGKRAVDGIGFDLDPGELLTIFGPNGVGKTTLLKILAGVLSPNEGQIMIDSNLVDVVQRSWRSQVGIVTHQTMLYDRLTVRENLLFYSKLFQ